MYSKLASVSKRRFMLLLATVLSSAGLCLGSKDAVHQLDLLCNQRIRMIGSYHLCLLPGANDLAVYSTYEDKPVHVGGLKASNPSTVFLTVAFDAPFGLTITLPDSGKIEADLTTVLRPDARKKIQLLHALQDTPCSDPSSRLKDDLLSPTPVQSILRGYGMEIALSCHENDLVCHFVDRYGIYANETLSQVALLPAGSLVLDVGTHIGIVSIVAAKMGHEVIGVEAASISVRRLRHNVALHELQNNVTILPVAAGRTYGCARHSIGWFTQDGYQNYGASSMVQWSTTASDANNHFEHVPIVPLQDMLPEARSVDLMKMDIEGSECHALLGLHRVFAEHRIKSIVLEVNSEALAGAGCSNAGLAHILHRMCMLTEPSMFELTLGDLLVVQAPEPCSVPALNEIEQSLSAVLGRALP